MLLGLWACRHAHKYTYFFIFFGLLAMVVVGVEWRTRFGPSLPPSWPPRGAASALLPMKPTRNRLSCFATTRPDGRLCAASALPNRALQEPDAADFKLLLKKLRAAAAADAKKEAATWANAFKKMAAH